MIMNISYFIQWTLMPGLGDRLREVVGILVRWSLREIPLYSERYFFKIQ